MIKYFSFRKYENVLMNNEEVKKFLDQKSMKRDTSY